MIVITGAAGFIGSNLLAALNQHGRSDILAVDDLSNGHKVSNLANKKIADYMDKAVFAERLRNKDLPNCEIMFHQGACSDTGEWDGRYMMDNNFEYSKHLLHYCQAKAVPLIYASSAAVYGPSQNFQEMPKNEHPINVYGYSKYLFDHYVTSFMPTNAQVVGLRYFNVYGPGEAHKGKMASVAYHLHQQMMRGERPKLFKASGNYAAGEQRRDFVYIDDVVKVNLWFWRETNKSGIYNVGTGRCQTFNEVANAVIAHHGGGEIEYIDFPESLRPHYQSYTEADISKLRRAGYSSKFIDVQQGVSAYLKNMDTH